MPDYNIRISIAKLRLDLYDASTRVRSFPVALGKIATSTPRGDFTIINKVPYPDSYPGGPLSVFGTYWLGLSKPHYGIHGTNNPSSIGKYVSHGCIRMYNQDVNTLASLVPIGTPVRIRAT
ncbi:L,D-transpeptidase [Brevibacillus nitrificans]|uniref:L,D-transpeptidase n=1 Tax=Brevibacillus nitrificans TaxID=651560 RepID=UPI0028605680|nr:L,D-transpeptidase [Brevibacillus nitrificans]MDR7318566.1 lipoprotein-anchoring transpeptidase ErfK/SrfK [Brevibacillus nitrificans]